MRTFPICRCRKGRVKFEGSTSSNNTTISACRSAIAFSKAVQKSPLKDVAPAPSSPPAPASAGASSSPSQKKSVEAKAPSPNVMAFNLADFAISIAFTSGRTAATPTTKPAEAGSCVTRSNAGMGVMSSSPATTSTRLRETVDGSCNEDKTCGKGSETPNSGSISQAACAPSTTTLAEPRDGGQVWSLPTMAGSSCNSPSNFIASSFLSAPTTNTMPKPQLNVELISASGTLPTAASQRSSAGSSQVSARSCACRCRGNVESKQCSRPPCATCAAPLINPARASASTLFT
mmetsp:Transcript_102720/g.296946  ORF Transcript_102720/g.296946 Transcript_102720/m.296946 type:complete len:290 (+) Transcript_102720:468-1337(+)